MLTSKDFPSLTAYAQYIQRQAQLNTERLQSIKTRREQSTLKVRLKLIQARLDLAGARLDAHSSRFPLN